MYYEKRAKFFRQRESWLDAISDYNEALKINPLGIHYMVELIELWLKNDDYREAKACKIKRDLLVWR